MKIITPLRLTLSLFGAIWGAGGILGLLSLEVEGDLFDVAPSDVIFALPAWLVAFVIDVAYGAGEALLGLPQTSTPFGLLPILIPFILFSVLIGAAVGFLVAVVIEMLTSRLYWRSSH